MIEVKQAKTFSELSGCLAGNPVEHPDHYAGDGKIECMDAMRSMMSGDTYALPAIAAHWWAESFKYIWRWRRKGGVQDLRKCRQCIDYLIAEIEGEQ